MSGLFSSKTKTSSTQSTQVPQAFQGFLDTALSRATSAGTEGFNRYEGPRIAELSGNEQAGIAGAGAQAGMYQPVVNMAMQAGTDMLGSNGGAPTQTQLNGFINPYVNYVLGNSLDRLQEQSDTNMTKIGSTAGMSGAFGGLRHGVLEGANLSELLKSARDLSGTTYSDAFDKGMGNWFKSQANQRENIGSVMNTVGQGQRYNTQDIQNLMSTGLTERTRDQAGLDFMFSEFMREDQDDINKASFLSSIAAQYPRDLFTKNTNTTSTTSESPLKTIAGIGLAAAGVMSGNPAALAGLGAGSSALGKGTGFNSNADVGPGDFVYDPNYGNAKGGLIKKYANGGMVKAGLAMASGDDPLSAFEYMNPEDVRKHDLGFADGGSVLNFLGLGSRIRDRRNKRNQGEASILPTVQPRQPFDWNTFLTQMNAESFTRPNRTSTVNPNYLQGLSLPQSINTNYTPMANQPMTPLNPGIPGPGGPAGLTGQILQRPVAQAPVNEPLSVYAGGGRVGPGERPGVDSRKFPDIKDDKSNWLALQGILNMFKSNPPDSFESNTTDMDYDRAEQLADRSIGEIRRSIPFAAAKKRREHAAKEAAMENYDFGAPVGNRSPLDAMVADMLSEPRPEMRSLQVGQDGNLAEPINEAETRAVMNHMRAVEALDPRNPFPSFQKNNPVPEVERYTAEDDMRNFRAKYPDATPLESPYIPYPYNPKGRKEYAKGGKVKSPAWQRKEGKNPEGGLNAKGRASYNAANPGKPGLKAPQPEGGSRKDSFCARMGGMKKKLTSSKTANDPDSRINKALKKWNCYAEGGFVEGGKGFTKSQDRVPAEMVDPLAALYYGMDSSAGKFQPDFKNLGRDDILAQTMGNARAGEGTITKAQARQQVPSFDTMSEVIDSLPMDPNEETRTFESTPMPAYTKSRTWDGVNEDVFMDGTFKNEQDNKIKDKNLSLNKHSLAFGQHQYLPSTWNTYVDRFMREDPETAKQLGVFKVKESDLAKFRDKKGDPGIAKVIPSFAARDYVYRNFYLPDSVKALQKADLPITELNLYLAHHLGQEGAVRAIPLMDNPKYANKTMKQVLLDAGLTTAANSKGNPWGDSVRQYKKTKNAAYEPYKGKYRGETIDETLAKGYANDLPGEPVPFNNADYISQEQRRQYLKEPTYRDVMREMLAPGNHRGVNAMTMRELPETSDTVVLGGKRFAEGGHVKGFAGGGRTGPDPLQQLLTMPENEEDWKTREPGFLEKARERSKDPNGIGRFDDFLSMIPGLDISPSTSGKVPTDQKIVLPIDDKGWNYKPNPNLYMDPLGEWGNSGDPVDNFYNEMSGMIGQPGPGYDPAAPEPSMDMQRGPGGGMDVADDDSDPEVAMLKQLYRDRLKEYVDHQKPKKESVFGMFGDVNEPLLKLGLSILASKGSFGEALGEAGLASLEDRDKRQMKDQQEKAEKLKEALDMRYKNAMIESMDPSSKLKLQQAKSEYDAHIAQMKLDGAIERAGLSGDRSQENAILSALMKKRDADPDYIYKQNELEWLQQRGVPVSNPEDAGESLF